MAIEVKIQRKLNTFELNIDFKSDSKRIGILGSIRMWKEHDTKEYCRNRAAGERIDQN